MARFCGCFGAWRALHAIHRKNFIVIPLVRRPDATFDRRHPIVRTDRRMPSFKRTAPPGLLLLVALLLVPVMIDRPPPDTFLVQQLFDFGHYPLFGLIALLLLGLSLSLWEGKLGRRLDHYLLAMGGVLALSGLTELVQFFGPRDASLGDVITDVAGAVTALALAASFDRRLIAADSGQGRRRRNRLRLGAVLLTVVALVPLASWVVAYRIRDSSFPVLCDFESRLAAKFVRTTGALLERVPPPAGWRTATPGRAGRVTFGGSLYPVLVFNEPYPDWTGFEFLSFRLYSESRQEMPLVLRVHDAAHDQRYEDRYNRKLAVPPGPSEIRIPLADLRLAPDGREMKMSTIRAVALFAVEPEQPFTIWIDDLRLE